MNNCPHNGLFIFLRQSRVASRSFLSERIVWHAKPIRWTIRETSLTLSAHALEGYSSHFVCLSDCLSVCLFVCQWLSRRWRTFSASKRHELKEYDNLSRFILPLF